LLFIVVKISIPNGPFFHASFKVVVVGCFS
jgi:hypothetical protein